MHVAGEMKVDVLHGHGLRVSAAGRSALNAENGAERRLTQSDNRVFVKLCHRFP